MIATNEEIRGTTIAEVILPQAIVIWIVETGKTIRTTEIVMMIGGEARNGNVTEVGTMKIGEGITNVEITADLMTVLPFPMFHPLERWAFPLVYSNHLPSTREGFPILLHPVHIP